MAVFTLIDDAGELVEHQDVVGRHHNGGARLGDLLQQSDDVGGGLRVEVAGGLVGDDDLRGVQQRAGNGDALLLASRELRRHLVALVEHAHVGEHFVDALVDGLFVAPTRSPEHEAQVLIDRVVVQELEVLEDDAHLLAQGGNLLAAYLREVATEHLCLVGLVFVDVYLAIHRLQERALSRAHLSDDVDELTLAGVEVDVLEDEGIGLVNLYVFVFY